MCVNSQLGVGNVTGTGKCVMLIWLRQSTEEEAEGTPQWQYEITHATVLVSHCSIALLRQQTSICV